MSKLSEVLRERGYVHQFSSQKLEEITDGKKRTVYLGIDPSADSLHVGNLVGLLVLRRFLEDGHTIIIVTGGGTGMIGDPGGKSEERNLLDEETIAHNSQAVAAQIRKVFGSTDFIEENNAKWLNSLNLIDFLREVGKHFTVNNMIKKDIVRDRLEKESPISFTEFSYSLLQGYDYLHLYEEYDCDVQVGGSDQWSNILAGVEFIRRKKEQTVYAFTWPLVMNKASGKKFGKSEQGAVWLDPEKTSAFQFYQFWLNTEDENLEEYMLKMTLLPKVDIAAALEMHTRNPHHRHGQRLIAREVTTLVHGSDVANRTEKISDILFGDAGLDTMSGDELRELLAAAPSCAIQPGTSILDALVQTKLASSKREARQFIGDGAVTLNGQAITSESETIAGEHFKSGLAILKRGKRNVSVLTIV
ncbi:tyrosine--tRNA ligase [Candidatus Kaiserbacteria bacterium]|nr:tyrosine--tRNA ligase [Candidatus Kaiserbacteria bacterium]